MYETIIDFLGFLGVTAFAPSTVYEFLVWFVLVMVSVSIVKFVLASFFWLVALVSKGGYR